MSQISEWMKTKWHILAGSVAAALLLIGAISFFQPQLFSGDVPSNGLEQSAASHLQDRIASRTAADQPEPVEDEPEPVPELKDPSLTIPSVKQMKYSKVWNPPDQGQYFWQIVDPAMGYPESGGTDYVLAHACENQKCAGDNIRKLNPEDTLTYKGEIYRVENKTQVMKDDIPELNIWEHHPDRLIIITCIIETTWWASDKNDVIIATKVF